MRSLFIRVKLLLVSFLFWGVEVDAHNEGTSLERLEMLAVEKAPELEQLISTRASLDASAIAEGTFKDPKLQAGITNVPTDTFSMAQENMTQIKLGLVQEFPRGSSLSLRTKQLQHMATGQGFKKSAMEAEILRAVRMSYIELYYLISAKKILQDAKRVFSHLVQVTTSALSVGKGLQHDVLRAQLDLTEVERKLVQIDEDIRKVRASLARLVGNDVAKSVRPHMAPKWHAPGNLAYIQSSLKHHPTIRMDDSLVDASKKGVEISNEQYKPAWSLGANYSVRQGSSGVPRKRRVDFVGVQLTTELPLFTKNRQDKLVVESIEKHKASRSIRRAHFLNLKKETEEYYASWEQLKLQENIFKRRLLPEAKQYAKATLNAYENRQADFPTVSRAHDKYLVTRLQAIRVQTKRQKVRAYLLYLEAK